MVPPYLPPPSYQQTIQEVAQCGLPSANIRFKHVAEHQLDVVVVAALDINLSPEQLRCVYVATIPKGYHVKFESPDQDTDFWEIVIQEGRRRAQREGEEWLRARGLFDRMPRYGGPGFSLVAFFRDVEAFCGLERGSAVQSVDAGGATFRTQFIEQLLADQTGTLADRLTCLRNVLAASDLGEPGVTFGFVGNGPAKSAGDRR